jgi:hypothetical protein
MTTCFLYLLRTDLMPPSLSPCSVLGIGQLRVCSYVQVGFVNHRHHPPPSRLPLPRVASPHVEPSRHQLLTADTFLRAMRNFSPKDPLYSILSSFLRPTSSPNSSNSQTLANSQSLANSNSHSIANTRAPANTSPPTCAYCATPCGRPIRDCAEVHGGRQALKHLIRQLDQEREDGQWSGSMEGMMEKRMGELYELYEAVSGAQWVQWVQWVWVLMVVIQWPK